MFLQKFYFRTEDDGKPINLLQVKFIDFEAITVPVSEPGGPEKGKIMHDVTFYLGDGVKTNAVMDPLAYYALVNQISFGIEDLLGGVEAKEPTREVPKDV